MRQFELRRPYRGKEIVAQVLQLPQGVHISLYGGDLPHIGAVGIADPDGNCTVTQFPGHREGVVCEKWVASLADAGFCPLVVEVGIHYDRLDKIGIEAVISMTSSLLEETLQLLSNSSIQT